MKTNTKLDCEEIVNYGIIQETPSFNVYVVKLSGALCQITVPKTANEEDWKRIGIEAQKLWDYSSIAFNCPFEFVSDVVLLSTFAMFKGVALTMF